MSPKYSSLAFDDALREIDHEYPVDINFEPDLKVIVNAHYSKTPLTALTSNDVIQIRGRMTVSF